MIRAQALSLALSLALTSPQFSAGSGDHRSPLTPLSEGASAEGCWRAKIELRQGMTMEGRLDLHVEGEKLTGKLAGPGGRSMPIEDGEAKDEKIAFALKGPGKKVKLTGSISGDAIEGEVEGPGKGKLPWSAKRCPKE